MWTKAVGCKCAHNILYMYDDASCWNPLLSISFMLITEGTKPEFPDPLLYHHTIYHMHIRCISYQMPLSCVLVKGGMVFPRPYTWCCGGCKRGVQRISSNGILPLRGSSFLFVPACKLDSVIASVSKWDDSGSHLWKTTSRSIAVSSVSLWCRVNIFLHTSWLKYLQGQPVLPLLPLNYDFSFDVRQVTFSTSTVSSCFCYFSSRICHITKMHPIRTRTVSLVGMLKT